MENVRLNHFFFSSIFYVLIFFFFLFPSCVTSTFFSFPFYVNFLLKTSHIAEIYENFPANELGGLFLISDFNEKFFLQFDKES